MPILSAFVAVPTIVPVEVPSWKSTFVIGPLGLYTLLAVNVKVRVEWRSFAAAPGG